MSKRIPACLARFPEQLDMETGRGCPGALARLLLVLLMIHGDEEMFSWVGSRRLGWLAKSDESGVAKARSLLVNAGALKRESRRTRSGLRHGCRVCLLPATEAEGRPRVFWPAGVGPLSNMTPPHVSEEQAGAVLSLVYAGVARNWIAALLLMYQFARVPEPGANAGPMSPHFAWIAGVLGVHISVVYRARDYARDRGLVRSEGSLLVFEDPNRWHELMGAPDIPPPPSWERGVAEPTRPKERPYLELVRPQAGERDGVADPSERAANSSNYAIRATTNEGSAAELIELAFAARGWQIAESLGREIIVEATRRWGLEVTRWRLYVELAGPYPTYALEPLGAALGPEFECPYQLVWSPELLASMRGFPPSLDLFQPPSLPRQSQL